MFNTSIHSSKLAGKMQLLDHHLGVIPGHIQNHRTFATLGPRQSAVSRSSSEGGARIINTENGYPNNAPKSMPQQQQPMMEAVDVMLINACRTRRLSLCRNVSECASEDSYIVFEGCDSDLDLEDYSSEFDSESDEDDEFEHAHKPDDDARKLPMLLAKKVRFSESNLFEVHPMITWSFAYRASRKGHWEEYARDRARFLRRIDCCGAAIGRILAPEHRERIYSERFKPPTSPAALIAHVDEKVNKKRNRRRRNGKKKRKHRHKYNKR